MRQKVSLLVSLFVVMGLPQWRDIAKDYLPPHTVPKENGNYIFMALPQQKMDEGTARKFILGILGKER